MLRLLGTDWLHSRHAHTHGQVCHLKGLISACGEQPVAVAIPHGLHDSVAVAVQGGNVAPRLGIPHLHQAVLTAAGDDCFGWVPVTALHVPPMAGHVALGSAGWEVPHLCCRFRPGLMVQSFNYSCTHPFTRSLNPSSVVHPFTHSHSFMHACMHAFVRSFVH